MELNFWTQLYVWGKPDNAHHLVNTVSTMKYDVQRYCFLVAGREDCRVQQSLNMFANAFHIDIIKYRVKSSYASILN